MACGYAVPEMYGTIQCCRICGNPNLVSLLHLGDQALTGVFPATPDANLNRGPLELVRCTAAAGVEVCGLGQLRHSYNSSDLYGDNYGYRSSLNGSMVEHLSWYSPGISGKTCCSVRPHSSPPDALRFVAAKPFRSGIVQLMYEHATSA